MSRLIDDIYVLLPTLTDEQIKEIQDNFADKNTEFREDYIEISQDDLKDQELESLIEQFEFWIGDLSKPQLKLFAAIVKNTKLDYAARYQRRLKQQREFTILLIQAKSGKNVKADIKELLINDNKFRNEQSIKSYNLNRIRSIEFIVLISETLDTKQKKHLCEKINDFTLLFNELIPVLYKNKK